MRKETFEFLSSDGKTPVHGVRWIPEKDPVAVLQIAHGMAEYAERYEPLALFMNSQGILVTGNDHLGHGKTAAGPEDYGYFAEKDGNRRVLDDLKKVQEMTGQLYPGVPFFLLGHSMGSFLCRQIMAERGNELDGAIVMGTGNQPSFMTAAGKLLCRVIALFKGWRYRSPMVNGIACGSYNDRFGEKGGFQWLSRSEENVSAYVRDPACGFCFTLNGFFNMFESIHLLADRAYVSRMPEDLPVLIVSGGDDPVGEFGKAPKAVEQECIGLGMKDVTLKIYPEDRHEIHMETDKEKVLGDISGWILEKCGTEAVSGT